jgi:hypothetical protein
MGIGSLEVERWVGSKGRRRDGRGWGRMAGPRKGGRIFGCWTFSYSRWEEVVRFGG